MILASQDFEDNQVISDRFTCRGEGDCPQLSISDVPEGAKSLCLLFHDPDAVGGDFTHWLVWNIPSLTTEIPCNSLPISCVEGTNGYGKTEYGAPCPPDGSGTHHYIFELYALDTELDLPDSTNQMQLRDAIKQNVIDQTVLTGIVQAKG